MKVFIVSGNPQYEAMYKEDGHEIVEDIADAQLVQFTGGEDVTPRLYGCGAHPHTMNSEARDERERAIFYECLDRGLPMVGICRGGQFLNVMSGGRMYQHIDGHATGRTHEVVDTMSGYRCQVTSTHHQMMIPANTGRILGSVNPSLSTFKDYVDRDGMIFTVEPEPDNLDVEVVAYEDYRTLCFQPHPEYEDGKACREWFFSLVEGELFDNWDRYHKLTQVRRHHKLDFLIPEDERLELADEIEEDDPEFFDDGEEF